MLTLLPQLGVRLPVYSFYPQGRTKAGECLEAAFDSAEQAEERAQQILEQHPEANEVSIWVADEYVGRVGAQKRRLAAESASA